MDFDFIIPLSIDGLQEASSSRQYAVAHVSSAKEIPQRLQECIQSFRKDGSKFIVDQNCFDSLYSVLVKFTSIEEETSMKVWELMIKVMEALATDVHNALSDDSSYSEFGLWLLALKMNTYIACNLTEAFESNFNKPSTDLALTGKKGRKGRKTNDLGVDWEEERTRMLVQLFSLIQAPLNRLWDPPVMDEDFVNLIANCCYKILETSSMNLVRTKTARDTIFQILGTLVKKFNHGLACSLKLMQLLQHFEHLVGPAAQGIAIMIETYGTKGVLQEMIREISKVDGQEFKDSSGLRNYSQFLQEVAEQCPAVFIPSLFLLVNFLEQDAYTMRNCVLHIMGSIVLKVLKGENLDSKSKTLRDECLGYLQEFIHDTNSFVRNKVLQVWVELIDGQAVPLAQQQPVLKKVVGRLRDKSSNVRKYALHLLAAFLKANPFAAKLPIEDLKKQFELEMKILEEMKPGVSLAPEEEEEEEIEVDSSIETIWIDAVPAIIKALNEVTKDESDMEDSDNSSSHSDNSSDKSETTAVEDKTESEVCDLPENFSLNDGLSAVGEALLQNKIFVAVRHLQRVLNCYPDDDVLQVNCEGNLNRFTYKGVDSLSKSRRRRFLILRRIFYSFMKKKQMEEEDKETAKDKEKEKKQMEFKKQKMLCCYLRDSINFARDIQKSLPDARQLLASRQTTDVMEAIDFFVTAFEFGVLDAMSGVRRMLVLIWSKEQSIKDAVVNAYRRLYINIDAANERARAFLIVRNLTALITGATLGELTSMEEIVSQFYRSGDINKQCITLLWERFTKTLPDTTDADSRSSLMLLNMAANSESSIISSNLNVLTEIGLGERADNDFALVKVVCLALCKLAPTKLKTDDPNPPLRFEKDHEMFKRLRNILIDNLFKESNVFCPMAVEVINAIYLLAEHPDVICGTIIQDMLHSMKRKSFDLEDRDVNTQGGICVSVPTLSRFLTVVGHVALRQLIHLDTFIFTELKRRNFLREEQEQKKKNQRHNKRKSHRKSVNITSASEVSVNKSQEPDIDEEMGLTGAVADDMEADYIRSICESEIVKSDALLADLRPLIIGICSNPTKYSDPNVRTTAALALAKFMLVSSECCEENLQLLFTILEKSEEATIRANTIIAIGDLTFRFPNLVEPWTPRIYARLRDESTFVQRNVLTVLTHLILNDQVKVKGQISDIALCLTDKDTRIAGLAKLFFNELAKKGNALYNVLPDIISRLSDTEIGTEEENFRIIISHIFGLIQKDRQLESFIEKLCYRLQATNIPRQWRDITFCLSLLPYSDKGIRKLSENFRCYSDKLHEEGVYDHFVTILATAKKTTKLDAKAAVEEFESKLEECHKKMVDDENLVSKARSANKKAQSKKGPRKASRRTRKSDSDSASDAEPNPNKNSKENLPPISRPRRSATLSKNVVAEKDTSESEVEEQHQEDSESTEEEEDEVFVTKKNTRIAKSAQKKSRRK